MVGINPDLKRQLIATLQRCDAFTSNTTLRNVFVDGRLSPWGYNVPEGENTSSRVQATIAFLHDKANMQGQNALLLLLYTLQDSYDPNDAYYSELGALIAKLSRASSGAAVPAASSPKINIGEKPATGHSPAPSPALPDRMRLLSLLTKHFSLDELNTLCFAVGVNYDELPGAGLSGKARELIGYCERRSSLPALINAGKTLRPELNWS